MTPTSRCGYVYEDGTVCGMQGIRSEKGTWLHVDWNGGHAFVPEQPSRCGYKYEDGTVCDVQDGGEVMSHADLLGHAFVPHDALPAFDSDGEPIQYQGPRIPQEAPQEASEGGLRPCPFCGGDAEMHEPDSLDDFYMVHCHNDCLVHPYAPGDTEELAAAAWNRRASVPTDEATDEQSLDEDVIQAAIAWWESKRPVGWSVERHMNGVVVNTADEIESALAGKVAMLVFARSVQPVSDTPKAEREENERVLRAFIPLASDTPKAEEE